MRTFVIEVHWFWDHAVKFARWQHPAVGCGARFAVHWHYLLTTKRCYNNEYVYIYQKGVILRTHYDVLRPRVRVIELRLTRLDCRRLLRSLKSTIFLHCCSSEDLR